MEALKQCHGMPWRKFVSYVKQNLLAFATSQNEDLRGAAKLADEHGIEAAAQWLAAAELVENNPPTRTLRAAVELYKDVAKRRKLDKLAKQLDDMDGHFYWLSGYGPITEPAEIKWPIRFPLRRLNDHAGILNFIMYRVLRDCDSTCGMVAGHAFTQFMQARRQTLARRV